MINRSLHSRTPDDEFTNPYGEADLATPPEAMEGEDPYASSTAFLGEPTGDTGELAPSEGGPAGYAMASLGMVANGLQGLSTQFPGFVPAEVTLWVQQAIQLLPQLIQQMQSGLGAGMPGAGMGMQQMGGQSAALGPAPQQQAPSAPSGPPRRF